MVYRFMAMYVVRCLASPTRRIGTLIDAAASWSGMGGNGGRL
jgi:hypothetical protein